MYGYALQRYGREAVLTHVGVEPTGEAFNSIVLDEVANRPFNPMVNAGAIAVAELMGGQTQEQRTANMLALFAGSPGASSASTSRYSAPRRRPATATAPSPI